jgi:HAD superfamily hydrolase (TIGR01450 family)
VSSEPPLIARYDGLLLDLDGVVQLDRQAIPGAVEVVNRLAADGLRVAFVTNNAARTPTEVAGRLKDIGVDAHPEQVVTSAVVAANLLAADVPRGAPVLVVGGEGLWQAAGDAGLRPVRSADDDPAAVIQGWGPEVAWTDLAEGCLALRAGARWVVTNDDRTLPSPRGPLPGSGSLVAALVTATDRRPDIVVGKPRPPLFEAARRQISASRPLMVGDRLDTDIAGAEAIGIPSLLVLTGISRPRDLLAAPPAGRPTHVGLDLGALEQPEPEVHMDEGGASCGSTRVSTEGGVSEQPDPLEGLRAAAALAWDGRLPAERYDAVLHELSLD